MSVVIEDLPYMLAIGPYTFNSMTNLLLRGPEDTGVILTRFEANILKCLLAIPGKVVSKKQINDLLYTGRLSPPASNGLEVLMRRLRNKLDPTGTLCPIHTLRGQGYKFRIDWPQQGSKEQAA